MKLFFILFGIVCSFTAIAQPGDSLKIKDRLNEKIKSYHIKTHMSNTVFETYVSETAVYAKQYMAGSDGSLPDRGILIRYQDDSVFKIDYKTGIIYRTTLAECNSTKTAERALAQKSVASFSEGNKAAVYAVKQFVQAHSLKKYKDLSTVQQTFKSPTGNNWKIYYLNTKNLTANENPKSTGKNYVDFLNPGPENIIVHAEVQNNGKTQTVIDLDEASELMVSSGLFAIPAGLQIKIQRPLVPAHLLHFKAGPGFKRDASSVVSPPIDVNMSQGPGPVIAHPSMYVIYWGKAFSSSSPVVANLATSMLDIVSPKYTSQLAFYGVNPGKVVRNVFVADDPSPSAGGGGSGAVVGAFLIKEIFDEGMPKIWWNVGGDDPLYMVVVTENEVDNGGWSGYHFVVPTYFDSFVPFPFNFLVHEELPYAFAKLPNNALGIGLEDLLQRDALCKTNPSACSAINSYDKGTKNISHEYVEVCTDPTPFFSWVDAGRGTEGEIGDICENSPAPFSSGSLINSTVVSTYWSVPDQACVPNGTATIVIKEPLDNSIVNWEAGGGKPTLFALATSPLTGDLEDIRWTDENGRSLGAGVNIQSQPLSLGNHTITATAFVNGSAGVAATTHVNVIARAPEPVITSPASNIQYASDDVINFRGSAMDIQDGDLPDNQLEWSINGTPIGTGKSLSAQVGKPGIAGVTLTATNSAGLKGSAAVLIKVGPPNGNSSIKIISPANATIFFNPDDVITFKAEAKQSDGTPVPENWIIWRDDLDGRLGTGSTIQHKLSGGPGGPIMHHVTVSILVKNGKPTPHDTIVIQKGRVL